MTTRHVFPQGKRIPPTTALTFSFKLHLGESAACEKGERGGEIRILNAREGSKMQHGGEGKGEGIKCVKFGGGGVH